MAATNMKEYFLIYGDHCAYLTETEIIDHEDCIEIVAEWFKISMILCRMNDYYDCVPYTLKRQSNYGSIKIPKYFDGEMFSYIE